MSRRQPGDAEDSAAGRSDDERTERLLADAYAESGEALFEAHPTTREIAEYSSRATTLLEDRRKAIERHLQGCPLCRQEAELVVDALNRPHSWIDDVRAAIRTWSARWRPLTAHPVYAALALLMIYPAAVGIQSMVGGDSTPAPAVGTDTQGVSFLYMTRTRGTSLPRLVVPEGRIHQPVIVDASLDLGAVVEVVLTTLDEAGRSGDPLLRKKMAAAEMRDEENHLLGLSLPAGLLTPGKYRLEIRDPASSEPVLAQSFEVVRSQSEVNP